MFDNALLKVVQNDGKIKLPSLASTCTLVHGFVQFCNGHIGCVFPIKTIDRYGCFIWNVVSSKVILYYSLFQSSCRKLEYFTSSTGALVASIGDTSAAWRLHTRVSGGGFMQLGWGGLGGGCFGGLLERNTSTQLRCSVARQTSHETLAKLSGNKPKWLFIFQYDQPLQVDSVLTHLESMP